MGFNSAFVGLKKLAMPKEHYQNWRTEAV